MPNPSTAAEHLVIEARQVSKHLPAGVAELRKAFADLSLDVHRGHRLALFSANAYEARALLDCLSGIERPDQGSVLHHGSVSWPVGSNQAFHNKLSGYMNARFAAEIYSPPGKVEDDLRLIQEVSGADDRLFHQPLGSWHSSMQKTLRLAVSLAFDFDVLAVGKIGNWDHRELHPESTRIRTLFEERIDGRTLIMAAPGQQKLALDYCDMGLAIVDGRLVYQGDPEICLELIKEEKQRTKDELRDEYNARLARLKDNDEGAEEYDD
ncbi:hypothetical protein [Cyanobium sp. ATX 6A2]|uniref:hypothetical protein n=1 Tax=Cyanobium sp. ATX 6A2 TaxID=2823700 RepID=UPI0020CE3847|nr:hypothetical protein [Cyanobium sp. ATX 6A2]